MDRLREVLKGGVMELTEMRNVVAALRNDMIEALCELVSFPAVAPRDGGVGEGKKADWLVSHARRLGFDDVERHDIPDAAFPQIVRPNVILRVPGREKGRLWIVSHLDVVPVGGRSLWENDPFSAVVRAGRVYGRGANDNGQEAIASLYAALALRRAGIVPQREICLAFVADEELGSVHGIRYLISKGLFEPSDLVLVPDGGTERGDFIEVAEKSILWVEFAVEGQQTHASRPDLGRNACRAANEFSVEIDHALHAAFPDTDGLFVPSSSTFEPTRRTANVANVNTIPGKEVFSFDCRVLPSVPLDEVLCVVDDVMRRVGERTGTVIRRELLQRGDAATPTSPDALIVRLLERAVKNVLGVRPTVGGIGGGTCAAYFRAAGIPAAVWAQESDTAHQPNEYAVIEHLENETLVFAQLMIGE